MKFCWDRKSLGLIDVGGTRSGERAIPFPLQPLSCMRYAHGMPSRQICTADLSCQAGDLQRSCKFKSCHGKPSSWLSFLPEFWKKNSEEVGFEPTDPSQGLLFSRQVQSATLPLFQEWANSTLDGLLSSRKLFQKTEVVFCEKTDVADVAEKHSEALDSQAPRVAGIDLRIDIPFF